MPAARFALTILLGFTLFAGKAALARAAATGDALPSQALAQVPASRVDVTSQVVVADDPWRTGSSTLAFNLGLGSAVGIVGLTYSYLPLSFLETEVGIGQGTTGTQFSIMPKIVLGRGKMRFTAGIGFAVSPGNGFAEDLSRRFWLNFDLLGFEIRTQYHMVFFLSGGLTRVIGKPIVIAPGGDDCGYSSSNPCPTGDATFPQIRTGVGGTF